MDAMTTGAVRNLNGTGRTGQPVVAVSEALETVVRKTILLIELHRAMTGGAHLTRDIAGSNRRARILVIKNVMFAMAICAHGGRRISVLDSKTVDAVIERVCDIRVAFGTCMRNIRLRNPGRWIHSLLHLMTAVAIHTVRGGSITPLQSRPVHASFICSDESCRGRHPSSNIWIIKVARKTELLLRDLELRRILFCCDVNDRVSMTVNARRCTLNSGDLSVCMG
jgi:hypothetical protein